MNIHDNRPFTAKKRNNFQSAYMKNSCSLQKKPHSSLSIRKRIVLNSHNLIKNTDDGSPEPIQFMRSKFIQIPLLHNHGHENNFQSQPKNKKPKSKQINQFPSKKKQIQRVKNFFGSKLQKKLFSYFLFISLASSYIGIRFAKKNQHKYVAYIGKGNNSKILKKLLLSRHWWSITNETKNEQINLIWTQSSKQSIFNRLSSGSRNIVNGIPLLTKKYNGNQYGLILSKKNREKLLKKNSQIESINQIKAYIIAQKNKQETPKIKITCNHIEGHQELTDKKNLFFCLQKYYSQRNQSCFQIVPLTFHIQATNVQETISIVQTKSCEIAEKEQRKIMWIVKPGENSNRGNGIKVFSEISEIKNYIQKCLLSQKYPNRTYILQRYINPALFHRRKFDIRCFVLLIANPSITAYFYNDGYLRTSSRQFKQKKVDDKYIHLTNDAIQKKGMNYGKYQKGNKVSFQEYQAYLDLFQRDKNINFREKIFPLIKFIAMKSISACVESTKINKNRHDYSFEILGYDFMLDDQYRPWLIQVNTNPCLEMGCPVLDNIIPSMLNNVMKIAVDPIFKPQKLAQWPLQAAITFPQIIFQNNKFEIIFGSQTPENSSTNNINTRKQEQIVEK